MQDIFILGNALKIVSEWFPMCHDPLSEELTTSQMHWAAQASTSPSPQHLLKAGHRKQKLNKIFRGM